MLYGGGWPYLTRGRAIVLMLALISLGGLFWQTRRADPAYISAWRGPNSAAQARGGLAGVARPIGQGMSAEARPWGNPLRVANTVMTQGYGVGSHAPAEAWGAVDLALDGNGDGLADPESSWDQPIYATHSGMIKVTPNSWPAGNHVWITSDTYRTGYAHLQKFAVTNGQLVRRGDVIGYIGSTGSSSGPHLDYQVWEKRGGAWVNVNPLDYGVVER